MERVKRSENRQDAVTRTDVTQKLLCLSKLFTAEKLYVIFHYLNPSPTLVCTYVEVYTGLSLVLSRRKILKKIYFSKGRKKNTFTL